MKKNKCKNPAVEWQYTLFSNPFCFRLLIIAFLLSSAASAFAQKDAHTSGLEYMNHKMRPALYSVGEEKASSRYGFNLNTTASSANPESAAREYLEKHAGQLGIDPSSATFGKPHIRHTPGGTHMRFMQTFDGLPVHGSQIDVTLDNSGRISAVTSSARTIAKNFRKQLNITAREAIEKALNRIDPEGALTVPERTELVIFESLDRGFETAWKVNFSTAEPRGAWELFVNASDGRIIHVQDKMMHTNGEGLVWDPDPLTRAGMEYGDMYADNNDVDSDELNAERVSARLPNLSYANGLYQLQGPYAVLADMENPVDSFPQFPDPTAFSFTRSQPGFEAVMCYYHIDRSTRRLVEFGYDEPAQLQFKVDPHGLDGDDNSHYDPNGNYVAFGEGGVDDAEDADVIWHEHAHSFQQNFTGGMSYSGETFSLQEGSADYWAASHSRYVNGSNWGALFNWDGHNEFWAGRRCDLTWVYPDDYKSGHAGGQIWSSALMDIWGELGRDITDQLFLETHYLWGYAPGLRDAAEAFMQADRNLFDGAHLDIITRHFDAHGLVQKTGNQFYTGAISGTVNINEIHNDSGILIRLHGPIEDSTLTASNGSYFFSNLVPGDYSIGIHKPGYFSADHVIQGISVAEDTVSGVDFVLESIMSALEDNEDKGIPADFRLDQNFPNPFNPSTRIPYQLAESRSVRLEIFNPLGERVSLLTDSDQPAGYYQVIWDATDAGGNRLASGIYIYRLTAGDYIQIRKMVLLK